MVTDTAVSKATTAQPTALSTVPDSWYAKNASTAESSTPLKIAPSDGPAIALSRISSDKFTALSTFGKIQ
jgi:hypothetical protein